MSMYNLSGNSNYSYISGAITKNLKGTTLNHRDTFYILRQITQFLLTSVGTIQVFLSVSLRPTVIETYGIPP